MVRSNSSEKIEDGDPQPAPTAASDLNDLKFEAALAELEQIVQSMEGGGLPLEESIAAYRRGSELLKHCQQQLGDAERKIQILENGALRDFDAASGESR
jgi:exodeoxyribonuclease VII small subunit